MTQTPVVWGTVLSLAAGALGFGCDGGAGGDGRGDPGLARAAGGVAAANAAPVPGAALLGRAQGETEISFEDVTSRAGLGEPLDCTMGHAVAFGDVDGDGWPDFVYGTFANRPPETYLCPEGPRPDRLFRNRGDGSFAHQPSAAVEQLGRASGAVFVDLDGDGDRDGVVTHNARRSGGPITELSNVLLRNDGGTLTDASAGSGLEVPGMSARNVLPLDYDGDGDLDLFIVEDKFTGTGSKLFRKRDDALSYEDVTAEAGLPVDLLGLGAAAADVNDDGWADLYVSDVDRLFVFDPAAGVFVHQAALDGTFAWPRRNDEDWTAGVAFGDLDRDGRLDLVVTHHFDSAHDDPVAPRVYLNRTDPGGEVRFERIDAGLAPIGAKAPHVEIQDLDNDGWPDIYVSVHVDVAGVRMPLVYVHTGSMDPLRFVANSVSLSPPEKNLNYGAAGPTADVDRDGRLDMLITEWWPDRHAVLYRNTSRAGNYLEVEVRRGTPDGIGARVHVYEPGALGEPDALIGLVEIGTGFGYSSGQEPVAHFGLAERGAVDLRVVLPHGGGTIDRRAVEANQRVTIG